MSNISHYLMMTVMKSTNDEDNDEDDSEDDDDDDDGDDDEIGHVIIIINMYNLFSVRYRCVPRRKSCYTMLIEFQAAARTCCPP